MAPTTISAAALLILLIPLLSAGGAAAAVDPPIGMPNCVRSCGGVDVPYPFGIGTDARCYLPGFNLTCDITRALDNTTGRLMLDADGTLQVLRIYPGSSILMAQLNGAVKLDGNGDGTLSSGLRRNGPYRLWYSELILTGCNVQATVKSGNVTVASCTSLCDDTADDDENGSVTDRCYGSSSGCCRANIVTRGYDGGSSSTYDVQLRWLGDRNHSSDIPVRVFVARREWFDDSSVYTDVLQTRRPPSKETMAVPVWLTWEVAGPPSNSVCKSNHSERTNGTRGGYACRCSQGYQGNPYLIDGCKDENECKKPHRYTGCYGECINTEGSFICRCPPGTTGNHSIPGGCVHPTNVDTASCVTSCGDVEVPYPFGFGPSKCYWPGFDLSCDPSHNPPRLLFGNTKNLVVNISIANSTMRIVRTGAIVNTQGPNPGSRESWTWAAGNELDDTQGPNPGSRESWTWAAGNELDDFPVSFSLSTSNELILTGCNAQATLSGYGNPAIISGCASFCAFNDTTASNTSLGVGGSSGGKYCYGMGCCQARISESRDGMPSDLTFEWFDGTDSKDLIPLPGYVFIAEEGWFDQPSVAGNIMSKGQDRRSAVAAMEVPMLLHWEILLSPNGSSLANASSYPDCDPEIASDLCKSKQSYCKPGNRGYMCHCNDGYDGNPYVQDGCKDGRVKSIKGKSIITGVASGAGLILLVLISYVITHKLKHQRAQMLKRKYFEQNRGQLLQQLVSQRADIAEKMIITLEELEKATNNFDKAREVGGGGHGTVYKGILSDLHVVAIKKPKMVLQREIDEFINEVAILSQINHKNVVKLYGCCLETEVPMLVYEFISNKTLYDHLHVEGPVSLSWADRLRIAIETARSLAYLHSTTSIPIIHRDIKPANILLDDTLTAKVADFGASRYIPVEKSGLTTMVQEGSLMEILDPQVMSEGGNNIEEIAEIAVACVKLRGEERPTMRQVELRLEAAQPPKGFEVNGDVAENSPLECREVSTSRQYSMEEEYNVSARYPR